MVRRSRLQLEQCSSCQTLDETRIGKDNKRRRLPKKPSSEKEQQPSSSRGKHDATPAKAPKAADSEVTAENDNRKIKSKIGTNHKLSRQKATPQVQSAVDQESNGEEKRPSDGHATAASASDEVSFEQRWMVVEEFLEREYQTWPIDRHLILCQNLIAMIPKWTKRVVRESAVKYEPKQ